VRASSPLMILVLPTAGTILESKQETTGQKMERLTEAAFTRAPITLPLLSPPRRLPDVSTPTLEVDEGS
jgi:hypothetical protein